VENLMKINAWHVMDCLIHESTGEYPEYDEEMKKFFPSYWNFIKSTLEQTFPSRAMRLKKEEDLIKSKFKNVDVEVRLNSMFQQNAWTIPGTSDMDDLVSPYGYYFTFATKSLPALMKLNLNDTRPGPNHTVIFPHNKCKFLIFTTKGLLTTFSPEQRLAVYLHEIGHWKYTATMIPRQLKHIKTERSATNAYMFLIAIGIYMRRFNEYEADAFSAMCGYGKELQSAFDMFGRKREGATWLIKLSDYLLRAGLKEQERQEEQEPGGLYPSMSQRKKQIKKQMTDKKYQKDA
jgi:Zn-dependent protease with chaperone function